MALEVGLQHTVRMTVAQQHTAAALGSGDLEVLATPALIAFLEMTCRDSVRSMIPKDSTTVGTHIEFDHLKASPVGAAILCHCTVTKTEGRLIDFEVRAESDGKLIGQGNHTRAVVDRERFLAGMNK